MFIELTDHLRCPEAHEESYLVLLPTAMDGRLVRAGVMGCPVCHREVAVADGVLDFGGGAEAGDPVTLTPAAAHALFGLDGPGGYLALIGVGSEWAGELAGLLPGIRLVLVNPPSGTADAPHASVVRASRLPLKASTMRGALIPAEFARRAEWLDQAVASVLPGLRIVGEGAPPDRPDLDLLAEAGGWWVGRRVVDGSGR